MIDSRGQEKVATGSTGLRRAGPDANRPRGSGRAPHGGFSAAETPKGEQSGVWKNKAVMSLKTIGRIVRGWKGNSYLIGKNETVISTQKKLFFWRNEAGMSLIIKTGRRGTLERSRNLTQNMRLSSKMPNLIEK
jgi:hypothetical protein